MVSIVEFSDAPPFLNVYSDFGSVYFLEIRDPLFLSTICVHSLCYLYLWPSLCTEDYSTKPTPLQAKYLRDSGDILS